jgi:hypothetical protein
VQTITDFATDYTGSANYSTGFASSWHSIALMITHFATDYTYLAERCNYIRVIGIGYIGLNIHFVGY